MNAIFFGAKRAFLSSVAITRRLMRSIAPGMTAARYDMMYVVAGRPTQGKPFRRVVTGVWQSEVRKTLGVSAPVVSRMVRSLVALGWIARRRDDYDGRQWSLRLTDEGFAHLLGAFRLVARFAKRLVHRVLCRHGRHRDREARFLAMGDAEARLDWIRQGCGDTATLWYWWPSPDD